MSDLRDLYQDVILDHSKRPRNFHKIEGASTANGHNPLCGDQLTVYLVMENGVVEDLAFEGSGCAISTAAASMMTQALKGKTKEEVDALFEVYHDVVTGKRVTTDTILGGLCVYMLMGIIWAIMYSFLYYLIPGSFSGLRVDSEVNRLLEFIYYSFVTLTTLGYGDLLPVNPIARALAYLEALIGQIYVAVLIAGLVSIRISYREKAARVED